MAETTDLMLERMFDAPRDLVWRAYTTPEHIMKWWAPRPYRTAECEIDLRPGGTFHTRMAGHDAFDTPVDAASSRSLNARSWYGPPRSPPATGRPPTGRRAAAR